MLSLSPNRAPLVGAGMVLAAATLWGGLGVAFRLLLAHLAVGVVGLAYLRSSLAFLALLAALALFRPRLLRVPLRGLPFLAAYGAISIGLFYLCYVAAVDLTSVATAVVLLYTAPAWVALLAWRFYGEPLTGRTLAALVTTFFGCILVAGIGESTAWTENSIGLLAGLGAGLTYGLYSIFGKRAIRTYNTWTVLVYILGFGSLCLAPVQLLADGTLLPAAMDGQGAVGLAVLAVGLTLAPFALYTEGLRRLPAGTASILGMWEPVVAALLGYAVLGEALSPSRLAGAALIVLGALFLRPDRPATRPVEAWPARPAASSRPPA